MDRTSFDIIWRVNLHLKILLLILRDNWWTSTIVYLRDVSFSQLADALNLFIWIGSYSYLIIMFCYYQSCLKRIYRNDIRNKCLHNIACILNAMNTTGRWTNDCVIFSISSWSKSKKDISKRINWQNMKKHIRTFSVWNISLFHLFYLK